MKHETELQRMSDKAAMDREKLKAKTAVLFLYAYC